MRPDLKLHIVAGVGLTAWASLVLPIGFAVGAACAVGAAKELVWDLLLRKGTPAWDDFLYTAAAAGFTGVLLDVAVKVVTSAA